ncbi:MAG TPA: HlyD family efflux transporter periplasmic adaptor subunit [Burkholderiales bacterium]|jgi:HlyD family secretion protein|nr:HlyD family efflux transporter periplasmic adaptor subunit [Burkholderiales bacterium]
MQRPRAAFVAAALALAACSQQEVRTFPGYAQAQYVHVAAPLSGNLARLNVRRGERVRSGQTLFSLQVEEEARALREAQARVKAAQAQLRAARRGAQEAPMRGAEAELNAAKAALAQAQWRLELKTAKAPRDGVVVETAYTVGEWVEAGLAVIAILAPQDIKVRFLVPSHVAAALHHGQGVRLRCPGCGEVSAEIAYVSPLAEPATEGQGAQRLHFLVEARPAPEAALRLHPGQPVEVVL